MDDTERQQLSAAIGNAFTFGHRVTIRRRFNGAAAGCPEIFQIQIGKELHGWFDTRTAAQTFRIAALSKHHDHEHRHDHKHHPTPRLRQSHSRPSSR